MILRNPLRELVLGHTSNRDPGAMAVVLLVADQPQQALDLVMAQQRLAASGLVVLDLNGETSHLLEGRDLQGGSLRWEAFVAQEHAAALWPDLEGPLRPWAAMLGLSIDSPTPPWLVPGLEDLQRVLWLADRLAVSMADPEVQTVTLVLPPLAQALPLLRLAQRAPELILSLWDPLLNWWSDTRQRLSHLELVLRLQLPSAESLRPPTPWLERCRLLAALLNNEQRLDVVLALSGDADSWPLQRRRLAALPLSGYPLHRLWIQGQGWSTPLLEGWSPPMLLGGTSPANQEDPLVTLLAQEAPRINLTDWEDQLCRVFAPGVGRGDLRVQQQEDALVISALGQRRIIALPEACRQREPASARVCAPFVEVVFR
ncbi:MULTISPECIES: hypothetical protein [unclassified Synechococcus]|uniref:hypothetical protein n=1 Tax=unclassified Synechococcus TaxID=2626047 RepID=UPI0013C31313|nr:MULTISPECIES: hypothetical protein [unclassified Synechococcus]